MANKIEVVAKYYSTQYLLAVEIIIAIVVIALVEMR